MSQQRLTDRSLAPYITGDTLIHIVNTGDTSQYFAGSSYKATIDQVANYINQGITTESYWTSGSSGTNSVVIINSSGLDATANRALAWGNQTLASGSDSTASGFETQATGSTSTAQGYQTVAGGSRAHAEGFQSRAMGNNSHAEGNASEANGNTSHAEGWISIANGDFSHAEGWITRADGGRSHSQGHLTIASGDYSHAGGYSSIASGETSFIHSTNSVVTGARSVLLGGQNLTGTTDDTVFVPNLNINILPFDASPVNSLGVNSNGNVVAIDTTFTGNTSGTCITDLFVTNITGCSPLHIDPSGVNDVYIVENGGNVGIGTTSPGGLLELYTSDNNSSINNRLRFRNDDTIAGPGGGTEEFIGLMDFYGNENQGDGVRSYIGTVQDGNAQTSIIFGTTSAASGITLNPTAVGGFPSEAMRIDPTGQVAIGIGQINDIDAKLHVNNIDSGYSFLVEDSANPDTTPFLINSGGTTSIGTEKIYRATPGGAETKFQVSIGDSGLPFSGLPISTTAIFESNTSNNIGLISPDANVNQIYFGTPSDAFGAYLRWDYTNRDFILSTGNVSGKTIFQTANGVEAARIDENGNFGIGTNTPQFTLDVVGETRMSGSGQNILTIIGSGDTQPLFTVVGDSGELFSITDSLVGELFSVNDASGLPILRVFDDDTVLMGSNQAPSLNTTVVTNPGTGLSTVYSLPMSAYTGAWYEYTVSNTGGVRAGSIMSVFSGNTAVLNEYSTTDIGNTSDIQFSVSADTTNAYLQVSATTTGWEVKTIIRSI